MDANHSEVGGGTQHAVLDLEGAVKVREQGGVGFELHVPKFTLEQGQFVGLVGESGCGKSTLLDMLALVLRPTRCAHFFLYEPGSGSQRRPIDIRALWESENEAQLARLRRTHLGYVLQSGGLLPFLTVGQNIQLPPRLKGLVGAQTKIRTLATRMGVGSLLTKKPQFLSGGQRQRVAILRAVAHNPMIVLADEPTAAVDQRRARAIVKDFHALASEHGSTIVMVTHAQDLIASVADCIYTYRVTQLSETLTHSVCVPQDA